MLRVENGEHALVQLAEELVQSLFEIDLSQIVVVLQVAKEVDENIGVALIDDAVGLLEELVELLLRRGQQVDEEFCKSGKEESPETCSTPTSQDHI